uniref:E3 ubiquitin-protein ligase UBR5 n=3 Tax=Parascaris univalens TaxID=6257 RepID=A0A915CIQ6_PARUN
MKRRIILEGMDDQKQLFLFAQSLPGDDHYLVERIKEATSARNRYGAMTTFALSHIEANNIIQMIVGRSHVAFLFKNGRVARLAYQLTVSKEEGVCNDEKPSSGSGGMGGPSSTNSAAGATNTSSNNSSGSGSSSTVAALNRTAKIRRVMLATRRSAALGERAGVIVDRTRPLVPVSDIPEDLIAQAQVVLQGKSRDVIVRELQRTNLNVNEAVNNLLSRDDEEADEMDDGSESYLPEELLSLLDAGLRSDARGTAVIDHDAFYAAAGEGFDYVVARDIARKRVDRGEKKGEKAKETSASGTSTKIKICDRLQYWGREEDSFPVGVSKFTKIVAMHSELVALADNGFIYGWAWDNDGSGSMTAHPFGVMILANAPNEEKFVDIVACAYRACLLTSSNRVASFLDCGACGARVSTQLLMPLSDIPDGEKVTSMHVCPMFSLIRTHTNSLYWWGIYPFNERRKLWERVRSRSRRHVTFDVTEIVQGCEVRTKSHPIYMAGSIAISFVTGTPMIGTLMESAWTLAELCRFRVQTPEQYDASTGEEGACSQTDKKSAVNQNGKRPREESTTPNFREAAWALSDVIFIHEESSQDTAIVKIVDGAYCGIIYKSPASPPKASASLDGAQPSDGSQQQNELAKLRLMRKDDLIVVSPTNKTPRSPQNFQKQLQKITLPGSLSLRKLHAVTVDNTGLRVLVEKRGRLHLARVSVFGKLLSDHLLPMNSAALYGTARCQPHLENYGDESLMVIRDGNGSMLPMCRDAVGGFREPVYLGLPPIHRFAVGLRHSESDVEVSGGGTTSACNSSSRQITRTGVLVTLVAPTPSTIQPPFPSLMQAILYCDTKGVELILDTLRKESADMIMWEVALSRCDGNRNILHAAVMNAFVTTNREDEDTVDVAIDFDKKITPSEATRIEMTAADQTRASYDQRWQRILRRRAGDPGEQLFFHDLITPMRRPGHEVGNVEDVLADIAKSFDDNKKGPIFFESVKDNNSMPILISPVADMKQRQLNAIEIAKIICRHPTTSAHLYELITTRDIHGHTPFMCAINVRAYSAAYVIWMAIEFLQRDVTAGVMAIPGKKQTPESIINAAIFPAGSKPDDSPLFVLCVNDTCSFTWTGDEHINQDIFECKTCGLVGTLCCCTECAFTCHRNHDCKLKRTSPTAYCDCWEKCSCKALVSGNTIRREKLLEAILHCTDLINQVDSRGEHLMLFLARTVGRQLVEQEHYQRRNATNKPKTVAPSDGVTPEHDLEPPKFARTAFVKLLADWQSVKSVIMLGVKWPQRDALVIEEVFHLNQQSGTSHLDKFVFTLLAKCTEAHMDSLLNTLITESNKKDFGEEKRDPDIDFVIARFIRSVIRLFAVLTLLSPVAAGVAAAASSGAVLIPVVNNGTALRRPLGPSFHAVSFSGLLSLVRTSNGRDNSAAKEAKRKSVTNFVLKCRRVFQTLISYSINELCNIADALIAPVRRGILKPTALIQQTNSGADCLEMLERYLAGEVDLSSLSTSRLDEVTTTKTAPKRRRQTSRRDTDHGGEDESHTNPGGALNALINVVDSDNSSDSESDEMTSVRHPINQESIADNVDAVEDEQRPKRYRGSYDDEELLSMSGDEGDDESMDSVSTPPDRDDEPTSNDNETNAEDDDAGEDGDSEVIVEYAGDERRGRREEDEGDRSYGEDDVYDMGEEDERFEREEEVEEGDGNDEREGHGNGDEEREREDEGSESTFSESNREGDDPYAFHVSTRSGHRSGEERRVTANRGNQTHSARTSDSADAATEHPNIADSGNGSQTRGDIHEGDHQETGNGARSANTEHSTDDRQSNNAEETNAGRSAEDDEVHNVTSASGGNSHERRSTSAMRVLFAGDVDGGSRSNAASRLTGGRSGRRNATFGDELPPPPPPPPSSSNGDGSARTSGVTSGRNNTVPLTWAVRRISSTSRRGSTRSRGAERDGENSDENDRFADSPSNGRSPSQHLRDAAAGEEDAQTSVNKTSQQLAMSFSIIARVIIDLMPMLVDYREYSKSTYSHISKMLELNDSIVAAVRREIEERLCPTWRWMESILDRTEAQLRFGNALMWSPAGALIVTNGRKSSSRKDEERRRGGRPGSVVYSPVSRPEYTTTAQPSSGRESGCKKNDDESQQVISRSDFFGYIFSLMRSSAAENGDDVPIIEFNALKALAFVADAYLSFVDMLERIDSAIANANGDQQNSAAPTHFVDMFEEEEEVESDDRSSPSVTTVREFFQRSNSLLYPGITASANHHAFEHKCSDSLALAERPQILRPGVEKEQLFGLPIEQRSAQDHERSAREHGTEYPAHQGLAAPWSTFKDFMPPTSTVKSGTHDAAALGRPNVIVHARSVSASDTTSAIPSKTRRCASSSLSTSPSMPPPRGFAPIKLESLMSSLHEKNQSHLHRSLARWKHALSLMAKAYHEQLMSGYGEELATSVLLTEMAGFSIREAQFRKKMEKFKAAQTKDLVFEVERDKQELIAQTIRQLNMHYTRRTTPSNSSASQSSSMTGGLATGRESGIVGRGGVRLVSLGSFWNNGNPQGSNPESNNPPL